MMMVVWDCFIKVYLNTWHNMLTAVVNMKGLTASKYTNTVMKTTKAFGLNW